ncbi:DUF1156 domain-containing protein [Halorubrum sp. Eb13]|jgi:adenine-specific DNA methylase|uniref:DUF1156 domain-containing protein n=1 Tax=Halorubrum sp. Eb13 TaxID=1383843 RepID=UPI000B996958|nr:DNA methyltransferase [Halorubrum sp. Eb13]OYR47834.1 hypothetical protein DJ75_03940 [Halorubrum sp. Eb13]
MSENTIDESDELKNLKIEGPLPTKTVGIESVKEGNPESMSPHRRIFKWFARRPTATTRLAILASVLPPDVSNDKLLRSMCIGPRTSGVSDIDDYVVKKYATKDDRTGSIEDHFGYEYPHKNVPSKSELEELHSTLREHWDGQLPTVLDPTAGGGTIPLEATRYGLPTISNELNPVAWLLNKVILEHAPKEGSIESDVRTWMNEIENIVQERLEPFFPEKNGVEPNQYFRAYSIDCPSCGKQIPVSNRWWFNRKKGIASRPQYEDEGLQFEIVHIPEDVSKDEFDPSEGTVSGGDIECPHCDVVTEREDVVSIFTNGEFSYEVCGVRYSESVQGSQYHSPSQEDRDALARAADKIESEIDLATLLTTDRYVGFYDRSAPYGITQWRDLYSPRQLLSHATYLDAFNEIKEDILDEYSQNRAEAILTLLSFISIKLIERNSRLQPIDIRRGSPSSMLGNNNFSFQWHFSESNLMSGTYSYQSESDNVLSNYEHISEYVSHLEDPDTTVRCGDASNLPIDTESIEAIVVDPPYGDNIIYSEVADAFYVWFREYLGDIYPEEFSTPETNKEDEAVENPSLVSDTESGSKREVARNKYENRMSDIFGEAYRVLEEGGVLTIYFTDKEIAAWDSLTMSIINSGFNITATHTITSEMPQRIGVQQDASADSTLLLTCRKPTTQPDDRMPTLWRDIKDETRQVAREKASSLLESEHNLTKTDTIISAFGPTLRVFTENYPVVDDKDELVRPREALREARTAVTEVLIQRELAGSLDDVDSLSTWYILSWLVYEQQSIPYDEARQLGLGVGVQIDEVKSDTKIWSKSRDDVVLSGHQGRVQSYSELESGVKRRARKYPVDPREQSFENRIDAVHAALDVLSTKGSDFAWNWLKERDLQNDSAFKSTIEGLLQVLPEQHDDYGLLKNLVSGETGELLEINIAVLQSPDDVESSRTTLDEF